MIYIYYIFLYLFDHSYPGWPPPAYFPALIISSTNNNYYANVGAIFNHDLFEQ
jgi:hypothetical protein